MSRTQIIVTIDGPAGVGKTTLARRLSEHLQIAYLDTGAMYRAVGWKLGMEALHWPEDHLESALKKLDFGMKKERGELVLTLEGKVLPEDIRTEEAGMAASSLGTLELVRRYMTRIQRDIGAAHSLVAEGRDMGTVVFPKARVKFFLEATPRERARRRCLQLRAMGRPADEEALLKQIEARDHQDRNRSLAPLVPAEDAVIIDTTDLDIKGVLVRMKQALEQRKIEGE